jgi:hypothetical protein
LRAGPAGQERVVGRHPHVVRDDAEPPLVGFAQEFVAPPLGHQPGGDVEILVVDRPLFLRLCMSWIVLRPPAETMSAARELTSP